MSDGYKCPCCGSEQLHIFSYFFDDTVLGLRCWRCDFTQNFVTARVDNSLYVLPSDDRVLLL